MYKKAEQSTVLTGTMVHTTHAPCGSTAVCGAVQYSTVYVQYATVLFFTVHCTVPYSTYVYNSEQLLHKFSVYCTAYLS